MIEAVAFLIFSLALMYVIYRSVRHDDLKIWRSSKAPPSQPQAFGQGNPKAGVKKPK